MRVKSNRVDSTMFIPDIILLGFDICVRSRAVHAVACHYTSHLQWTTIQFTHHKILGISVRGRNKTKCDTSDIANTAAARLAQQEDPARPPVANTAAGPLSMGIISPAVSSNSVNNMFVIDDEEKPKQE